MKKRILSMLLVLVMVLGMVPAQAFAAGTQTVMLSIEKRTIGKGDLLSATEVDLQEGDTAWTLLKREMDAREITYRYSGGDDKAYLQEVDGDGEFSHGSMSGWVYKVNDKLPNVGMSQFKLEAGQEMRVCYTTNWADINAPLVQHLKSVAENAGNLLSAGSYTAATADVLKNALAEADKIIADPQYNSTAADKELVVSTHIGKINTAVAGLKEAAGDPAAPGEIPADFQNDLWLQYDFKEMKVGDTADIYPRRVPQAISSTTENEVERPNFNFEIVSGDSITLSTADSKDKSVATANKPGVTVVKVTYDAFDHSKAGNFGASSSVNTAYAVFAVSAADAQDTGITITPNTAIRSGEPLTSYDTIYFTEGNSVNYSFAPTIANADEVTVTCNGHRIQGNNGTYTLPLENRSNVIGVTMKNAKGTKYYYQVIDARKIEVIVENASNPGEKLIAGDAAKISFKGITPPVYKLATIYNPTMNAWDGKGSYISYTQNELSSAPLKGVSGQYDMATNNAINVTIQNAGTYTFTGGKIFTSWWGSKLGSDKGVFGQGDPNLNAPVMERFFSNLPDFTVTVAENTRTPDQQAAYEVDKLIAGIGKVQLNSESKIKTARTAYDALTDAQKKLVTKLSVLEDAEKALLQMKNDKQEATKVQNLIKANCFPISKVTLATKEKVVKAREAYDALTDAQRALVLRPYVMWLTNAENKIAKLENEAAAGKVEAMIDAIGTVTADKEQLVKDARKAYDALTEEQKKLVKNVAVLEAAEEILKDVLFEAVETVTLSMEQDNFYAVLPQQAEVSEDLSKTYGYVDQVVNKVSVLDVLIKAHEIMFAEAFTPETKDAFLVVSDTGFISTVMGQETSAFGFAVNGMTPNDGVLNPEYGTYTGYSSNQAQVKTDDTVQFFFYNPEGYWGEIYTNFLDGEEHITELELFTGEEKNLTVKGYSYVYEGCNEKINWKPVKGMQVCTLETEGEMAGMLSPISGVVTDEETGGFTLKFDQAGTYYLAVTSDPDMLTFIIPQLCKVTVKENHSADVQVSIQKDDVYPLAPQTVTVKENLSDLYGYKDQVADGVSVLDVMIKAHEMLYGEQFTADTKDQFLAVNDYGFVEAMMKEKTSSVGFAVNGMAPNDGVLNPSYGAYTGYSANQAKVQSKDRVQLFFYNPNGAWGEYYASINTNPQIAENLVTDVRYTMNVKGFQFAYEGCSPAQNWKNLSDLQLCVLQKDGALAGKLVPIQGAATDKQGNVQFTFAAPGTYQLAVASNSSAGTYVIPEICTVTVNQAAVDSNARDVFEAAGNYLQNTVKAPQVGSIGGEWTVLGLARAGVKVPAAYYNDYCQRVTQYVAQNADENGRLNPRKSTDNSRVILALTALGMDPADVNGHNLLAGISDMQYLEKQGINGPIWALIALDSRNYEIPKAANAANQVTREGLIETILNAQTAEGGWNLDGDPDKAPSVDMTAMALQALAPYYHENPAVKAAVDKAVSLLSSLQKADGGYEDEYGTSSESCAQVIVALSALGIDADQDSRFAKNGHSVVDALCSYAKQDGGLAHMADKDSDLMATEQGYYALDAYFRFLEGKNALYDMTDVALHTHTYTWTVTKAPTTEAEGEMTGTCVCGHTMKKTVPMLDKKGDIIVNSHKDNALGAKLADQDVVSKLILSDRDMEALTAGKDLTVTLKVTDISGTVSQADKSAILSALGDRQIGIYLDVSLMQQVGDEQEIAVHSTKENLKISIQVPEALRKSGRTFSIIRLHDGKTTVLPCELDKKTNTVTFESDRFSTFALVYTDVKTDIPTTGDESHVAMLTLTLSASFMAAAVLLYTDRRKKSANQ